MKKINKYLSLGVVATLGIGLISSCNDTTIDYPYNPETGEFAYFNTNLPSRFTLSEDGKSFTVQVFRSSTAGSYSVPITETPQQGNTANNAFTFPQSVTFTDGSNTANFVVTYDIEKIQYDETQSFRLQIDEPYVTAYGPSILDISAVYPSPWTVLGNATYTDYFVGTFFGVGDEAYELEISQNDINPGIYRLKNPYGAAYPYNEPGDWDESQDYYLYINATDPDQVFICDGNGDPAFFYSGMDWGYGEFVMSTLASYYLRNGNAAQAAPYFGNMADGVIYLAGSSTLCGMTDYNDGGLYSRNFNGPAQWVVLPGYSVADASVTVLYEGLLYKADNTLEVVTSIELGSDVESAKLAIVPGASPTSAQIDQINSGEIESIEVTSTGTYNIIFDENNAEGKYSIVAITYIGGEMRSQGSASFTYTPANAETWAYVNTGTFTFLTDMFGEDDDDIVTDILDLYQSETTPGKYKVAGWMSDDYPLIFTMDDDGIITVPEQETGLQSSYGMIYVQDMYHYYADKNPDLQWESYYEDGVYNFAVIYYVSEGYFARGYETYEPDAPTGANISTRSMARPFEKIVKSSLKQNRSGLKFIAPASMVFPQ